MNVGRIFVENKPDGCTKCPFCVGGKCCAAENRMIPGVAIEEIRVKNGDAPPTWCPFLVADDDDQRVWIIGVGGSEMDGVAIMRCVGTKEWVKERMFAAVLGERNLCDVANDYDFGTECVEEIEERADGSLYAFNCFCDHHTDYEAVPGFGIPTLYERS